MGGNVRKCQKHPVGNVEKMCESRRKLAKNRRKMRQFETNFPFFPVPFSPFFDSRATFPSGAFDDFCRTGPLEKWKISDQLTMADFSVRAEACAYENSKFPKKIPKEKPKKIQKYAKFQNCDKIDTDAEKWTALGHCLGQYWANVPIPRVMQVSDPATFTIAGRIHVQLPKARMFRRRHRGDVVRKWAAGRPTSTEKPSVYNMTDRPKRTKSGDFIAQQKW